VEIYELIYCLNGTLSARAHYEIPYCFDVCDANGDGVITIDEVVLAVNYAIDGCPP
jgi:hypothetical protein